MNKLSLCILSLIVLLVCPAVDAQVGDAAYNFLNVTTSARVYGLGGMNITTVDDDLSTTAQNPALLGAEMSGAVSLGYMRYLGNSNFASVRYAHAVSEHGALAGSIDYFGYGSMTETLPDGSTVGSFSPKDVTFGVAYGHDIADYLRGGIAVKGISSNYADYTAFALATDLGINYYDPERDLSLSIVGANLGGQVKRFADNYNRLPMDVRLGWSQSFGAFPIRFSVTAWDLTHWHLPYIEHNDGSFGQGSVVKDNFADNLFRHLVFGAELISSDSYYLTLGYNYRQRTDMSTYSRSLVSGFSLGGGLRVSDFAVSVALAQPHTGGMSFMLNLGLNINDFIH